MDELFFGTLHFSVCRAQFRLSTDSMVLADFCRSGVRGQVLDLGCGCGALSLLLLGAHPKLRVTGIELQPDAAQQAQENAARNDLCGRFTVVCGDLRQPHAQLRPGSFACVVSNPPYFPPQSGYCSEAEALRLARSEAGCTLAELCAAAARALQWGGRFFLVHKPERLVDLAVSLRAARLEPKRIRFVRHRAQSAVSLVLLEARLGGKPGLGYEPDLILYDADGRESAEYRRIYHQQE